MDQITSFDYYWKYYEKGPGLLHHLSDYLDQPTVLGPIKVILLLLKFVAEWLLVILLVATLVVPPVSMALWWLVGGGNYGLCWRLYEQGPGMLHRGWDWLRPRLKRAILLLLVIAYRHLWPLLHVTYLHLTTRWTAYRLDRATAQSIQRFDSLLAAIRQAAMKRKI